jgi:hypothetical protein
MASDDIDLSKGDPDRADSASERRRRRRQSTADTKSSSSSNESFTEREVRELDEQLDPIARLERMGQQLSDRLAAALPAPAAKELHEGDIDGE